MVDPVYLGDGLYAAYDGYMIELTADLGSPNERKVWLEPAVFAALIRYSAKTWPGLAEESVPRAEKGPQA
jgi:hypothetical protein